MKRFTAPLIVAVLGGLWIMAGTLLVPSLIRSAYRGESIDALNAVIVGQGTHPVEAYLEKWYGFLWVTIIALVAVVTLVSSIKPTRLIVLWKRLWFSPTPLGYLSVCRIVCVATQLVLLITVNVYNRQQFIELSALPSSLYDPMPVLGAFLWPWGAGMRPSLEAVTVVYWLTVAAGAFALVGLRSNSSLLIFAGGCTFLQAFSYSFGDLHHPEALMIITLWVLALSPSGRSLSLDDILSRGLAFSRVKAQALKRSRFAGWSLMLVQCLFAIIYLDAAIRKLSAGGLDWMNGYTLQYYLISDAHLRNNDWGIWLGQQHILSWILSWFSIAFEATFILVLLVPMLVWIYIPLGIAFHVGNDLVGVASFYQYVAIYTVFLPQFVSTRPRLAAYVDSYWSKPPRTQPREAGVVPMTREGAVNRPLIIFDGACNVCTGWVQFIIKRDMRARVAFAPFESTAARAILAARGVQGLDRSSVVLVEGNALYLKSDAVLKVAAYLGGAWPMMKIFRLVPLSLRNRCYDIFARNRYGWFGRSESCMMHTENVRSRFVDSFLTGHGPLRLPGKVGSDDSSLKEPS